MWSGTTHFLVYNGYKSGDGTRPCGTPELMVNTLDRLLLSLCLFRPKVKDSLTRGQLNSNMKEFVEHSGWIIMLKAQL